MSVIDYLLELFAEHGQAAYLGEQVSQTEHALQAAALAEQAARAPELIAAALLHDVGHLLDARAADPTRIDADHEHEELGARWLEQHFGPAVTRPVAMHVTAKRYLCATEDGYVARLSSASIASLRLQGGPFTPEQVEAFRADPFARSAVALRRWDEQAKVAGLPTPSLRTFLRTWKPHWLGSKAGVLTPRSASFSANRSTSLASRNGGPCPGQISCGARSASRRIDCRLSIGSTEKQ